MVGVVKIQIFLLLVPILHNSQLAPRPHHQLQKKTLIIVVAHFLFLSYSLSLQLYMLQQLGFFFSCRVEKKKKQQATSMDRTRQKRQNLSFFLLCFSNSGQISQDSNVDSLRDCWRIWAPSESTSMLQGKPMVRSAAHCYQTAPVPPPSASGSGSMAQEISFFQLAWPRLPSSAAPLELLLQVECLLPLPLYSARFLPNCPYCLLTSSALPFAQTGPE